MTVQTVRLGGKKFVILHEKDYRELKARPKPTKLKTARGRGLSARDRGDIAESRRRMKEAGGGTLAEVRQRLGL